MGRRRKCDKARDMERVDGRRGGFGVWRGEIVKQGRDTVTNRRGRLPSRRLLAFLAFVNYAFSVAAADVAEGSQLYNTYSSIKTTAKSPAYTSAVRATSPYVLSHIRKMRSFGSVFPGVARKLITTPKICDPTSTTATMM